MRKRIWLILLAGVFLGSCGSKGKTEILGIDSMRSVMWDMLRADELYTRLLAKDSTLKAKREDIRLYETVYAIHKIRKGQFDSSYKYYEAHPVAFRRLLDSLNEFSSRERNRMFNYGQGH